MTVRCCCAIFKDTKRQHKTVRDQGPLIEKFAATAPADFANIKVDVDSVLRLTIPTERTSTSDRTMTTIVGILKVAWPADPRA